MSDSDSSGGVSGSEQIKSYAAPDEPTEGKPVMIDRQLVDSIKQAFKEIEQEKQHDEVHSEIRARLYKQVPVGKYGAAKCGICSKLFEYRNLGSI